MWVESEENIGTTFYFTLSYTKNTIPTAKQTDSLSDTPNTSSYKTVLVVEDVESNYLYIEALLKSLKIKIIWAKTGNEGINFCKENPQIDLVLMDILLPEINGYEATKQIKKFRPKLPIIAQTAFAMYGDNEKAFEAGCDDYIAKPIKKQLLLDLIKKYLD